MNGHSDGTFRPDSSVSRQQVWMVPARMSGASPADMDEARMWAVNSGVSDGGGPESPTSRQQLVAALYRFAQRQGLAVPGFADLSEFSGSGLAEDYARAALAWGVVNGVVAGTADGRLNPDGTATCAQFAAFIHRYSALNPASAASSAS